MGNSVYNKHLDTKQKALAINLNPSIYGSFAEIGAGQDVASTFFKAGAASGTIAKTISAYDMTFSDSIYGVEESGRYVCENRLMKMLDREYNLLLTRLNEKRGSNTHFFSFADTISALNYHKTNEGHGWLGIRFQNKPTGASNDVILHVKLLDNDNILQQQAIGIIGTNLIYACFYYSDSPETFLHSLMDNLSKDRIQIDMIRFEGELYKSFDNRLMSLYLVKFGYSEVALFSPEGKNLQPSEVLYKNNVAVIRGRFRPMTNVNQDMISFGVSQFLEDPEVEKDKLIILTELTLQNLKDDNDIKEKDFLDRVDILCSMGHNVLISNCLEYYKIVGYLAKTARRKIALIMGLPNLYYIFDESHYGDLKGGILEAFSILFGQNTKLYIYPTLEKESQKVTTMEEFIPSESLKFLYQYALQRKKIEGIKKYTHANLSISADKVLQLIQWGSEGWENMVPPTVFNMIKKRCLFGFPCELDVTHLSNPHHS